MCRKETNEKNNKSEGKCIYYLNSNSNNEKLII